MSKIAISNNEEFVNLFMDEYLADGMGAMPKREVDILVMNLLLNYGDLKDKSNQELSILLQTPEATIKRLRYEARLKYPPDEDYVKREFLIVLNKSIFELDKKNETDIDKMKIIFVMEDDYLRHAIQGHLKDKGMFADTSFNREIVKIECSSLKSIIGELYDQETAQQFRDGFNSLLGVAESERDNNFKDSMKQFIIATATKVFVDVAANVILARCGLS